MRDIVQIEARERRHAHILDDTHLSDLLHRIVAAAVFERDEGVETARFVLQPPEAVEVVDTVVERFDMPVEYRSVGRDAEQVCGTVHGQPLVGRSFFGTDAGADRFGENLGAAAGDRFHAGLFEPAKPLFERQPCLVDHIGQFDGCESLDRCLWHPALDRSDQVDVIIESVARVYPSDDVDFGRAATSVAVYLREDLLFGIIPRVGRVGRAAVGAETAVEDADVRRLDMEIPVIENGFAAFAFFCVRR